MNSVWIGFIGVIVGGLITSVWSLLAVVRQELSGGMVAARLVDANLATLDQGRPSPSGEPGRPMDDRVWEQSRASLARVLGREQWAKVSAAYRHYDHPLPE